MKRIYVQKITQHETTYYIGKADPRDLVRIANKIEVGETQEAQRPLQENKVKQIAKHVEEGLLPNTLVLATCKPELSVKTVLVKDDSDRETELYYIDMPVTDKEFKDYENSVEAMDGQHRLYSFDQKWRLLKDNTNFEIGFTLFVTPDLKKQREIFLICNEKQEKVSSNLLMYYKEKLKMLEGAEKAYFSLVNRLSFETQSPLKDRIIMSAEKITNGIKAQQLILVLDKAKINMLSTTDNAKLSEDKLLNLICTYLKGWQKAIDFSFKKPNSKKDGSAYKIAGLRFMFELLPSFWRKAINDHKTFTEEFVVDTINQLLSNLALAPDELFTGIQAQTYFRERTGTMAFAEHCSDIVGKIGSGNFDPLA